MPQLTVHHAGKKSVFEVPPGTNLRKFLLQEGISPYAAATRKLNCRGNGLCATCGVEILEGESAPTHWHDKLAKRYRYPRLSCQIELQEPLVIRIIDEKKVWGKRLGKQ